MNAPSPFGGNTGRVVLVLQGGGAMGAYQAGVYQALHEHGATPSWVVGTSIGAINATLIAGNERSQRLARMRQFWDMVGRGDLLDMKDVPDSLRQYNIRLSTAQALWAGVPGFFTPRGVTPFALGQEVEPELASFYDTSPLRETLTQLVDFDFINAEESIRLAVNAVGVSTGELVCFDSEKLKIQLEHVMASCALPPGFPPVRVDGQLYWDGGLYSNTPLEVVLEDEPRVDTLCFMVDLWRSRGVEPRSFTAVQNREKDVRYASRSDRHVEAYKKMHNLRRAVRLLHSKLPPDIGDLPDIQELGELGCHTTMHIVRLVYPGQDWSMPLKDVNFSRGSIEWRWEQGYHDTRRALQEASWLKPVPDDMAVVVHEYVPA